MGQHGDGDGRRCPRGYNGTFTVTASDCHDVHLHGPDLDLGTVLRRSLYSTVHAVVGNGQQSTTGQMTLSGDGQFLFLTGYDNNPLNAATALPVPTASGNAAVPRAIARIKFDGTVQTEAFSTAARRSPAVTSTASTAPTATSSTSAASSGYSILLLHPSASRAATATITSSRRHGEWPGKRQRQPGRRSLPYGAGTAFLVAQFTGFPTANTNAVAIATLTESTPGRDDRHGHDHRPPTVSPPALP